MAYVLVSDKMWVVSGSASAATAGTIQTAPKTF